MAHLVTEIRPDIPLRFLSWGETRILHDVDGVINWFRGRGSIVEEINTDRVFAEGWQGASWQEQRDAQKHDREKIAEGGFDLVFLGLRAEESRVRAISLRRDRSPDLPLHCYRYRGGHRDGTIRCCPLARWTTEDVGAYLASYEIPLLEDYHHRGVEARTTARITERVINYNGLTHMKRHKPKRWSMLIRRFPELRGLA